MRTRTWSRILLSEEEFGVAPDATSRLPWVAEGVATVRRVASSVEIQVGPYAGTLSVRPGLTIEINELVPGTVRACLELSRSGRRQADQAGGGFPQLDPTLALAERFVEQCSSLVETGPLKEYVLHKASLQRPKGKISVGGTLGGPWARGRDSIVVCQWRRLTEDTPLNRVLLSAAVRAERIIRRHRGVSRRARVLLLELSGAELVAGPADIPAASTPDVAAVLALAWSLIKGVPLSLSTGTDDNPQSAWVNVERVFEEAIFELCRRHVAEGHVYKGAGSGTLLFHSLPSEPRALAKSAEPDVVIDNNGRRLLLDAKYRASGEHPDDSEIYQLIAHAVAYGAAAAALVTPALKCPPTVRRLGRIATGCIFEVISVDTASVQSMEEGVCKWLEGHHADPPRDVFDEVRSD